MTAISGSRAGRREWIALAVIALPCLLYSMDLSVLYLALPSLTADLKPSGAQLLWISDIYGFMIAGFLITMGNLGDRIGRRRLLLIGAAAFGCASVLAAFATNVAMLIVARALLGIAAATLAPSTLSLIRNMFRDPRQRTFAIGVWVTSFSLGAALGPLLGGLLLPRAGAATRVPQPRRRPPRPRQRRPLARVRAGTRLRHQRARPERLRTRARTVDACRRRNRARLPAPAASARRAARRPATVAPAGIRRSTGRQHTQLVPDLRQLLPDRAVPAAGARPLTARSRPLDGAVLARLHR